MQVLETPTANVVSFSPLLRRYTLEEFWELPEPEDRAHYELITGVLFLVPPPDLVHGDLDSWLNLSLIPFIEANGRLGSVYHPRAVIYIDNTCLEPGMMYVSNE